MNPSGCKDPKAEIAIARVMKEERRRQKHEQKIISEWTYHRSR